jgi:hypothetical protein
MTAVHKLTTNWGVRYQLSYPLHATHSKTQQIGAKWAITGASLLDTFKLLKQTLHQISNHWVQHGCREIMLATNPSSPFHSLTQGKILETFKSFTHLALIMYASHHIHHNILHQSCMHQTMHHTVTYLNVHHASCVKHACITLASKQSIKLHSLWHVLTYHSWILHHICV